MAIWFDEDVRRLNYSTGATSCSASSGDDRDRTGPHAKESEGTIRATTCPVARAIRTGFTACVTTDPPQKYYMKRFTADVGQDSVISRRRRRFHLRDGPRRGQTGVTCRGARLAARGLTIDVDEFMGVKSHRAKRANA